MKRITDFFGKKKNQNNPEVSTNSNLTVTHNEVNEGVPNISTPGPSSSTMLHDLGTFQTGPARPIQANYPVTKFGSQNRCFLKSHYEEFNWLEYSAAQNCAFCFPCRMFYNKCIANSEDGFVKVGFRNWKKAIEKFSRHEKSSVHLANVEKLVLHKISEETGSINTHLSNEYKQEVERNVAYLSKVFDIVMFLGKQGLALRGHDEKKSSSSKGNFLEMCEFLGKYDTSFAASYNKKISYCSKDVQNEIVDIITSIAIEKIVKQVKNCGFYAIMADEARCQKEQQLSFCIRYVNGDLTPTECFLTFRNCFDKRTAAELSSLLLSLFQEFGIADLPTVAQTYDGASVMSGVNTGYWPADQSKRSIS